VKSAASIATADLSAKRSDFTDAFTMRHIQQKASKTYQQFGLSPRFWAQGYPALFSS
jgi:hypothetical protein